MSIIAASQHRKASSPDQIVALIIWLLASVYLYVDTLTGFTLWRFGVSAPFSQSWKGLLLASILVWSAIVSATLFRWILLATLLLLSGPTLRLFETGATRPFAELLIVAFKVLLPFAVLCFGNWAQLNHTELAWKWGQRVLWLSLVAIILNLGAGAAGFGFTSYGSASDGGIGIVGFFPAGNEVSSVFAVVVGFALIKTWLWRRGLYPFVAILSVIAGFLIATKAAIGSTVLFAFLIPFAYKRGTWNKFSVGGTIFFIIAICMLTWGVIKLWDILKIFGLADRFLQIYETRGILGILMSGRDVAVGRAMNILEGLRGTGALLFGIGPDRLVHLGAKAASTEVDPVDLYLWLGIPGIVYGLLTYFAFFYITI